ncbi:hypothetical protein AB0F72_30170 [Actinoplanes sp. NPDC023936]|uniref:hypothetical protein n=1 Tax=Actinoplanes sp. NPDC023936 TaxID=3154910 RepID=UPI00340C8064
MPATAHQTSAADAPAAEAETLTADRATALKRSRRVPAPMVQDLRRKMIGRFPELMEGLLFTRGKRRKGNGPKNGRGPPRSGTDK